MCLAVKSEGGYGPENCFRLPVHPAFLWPRPLPLTLKPTWAIHMIPFRRLILISLLALPGIGRFTSKLRASEETALAHGVLVVRASVQEAPPRITLEWPRVGGSGGFAVFRKTAEANSWGGAYANLTDANATRFADDKVVAGVGYEYKVETVGVLPNAGSRQPGGTKASGVLYSGIALPPVDRRGRIILLVDETMAAPLAGELEQTPSLPDARPRSDRFRCGGRESNFLAAIS